MPAHKMSSTGLLQKNKVASVMDTYLCIASSVSHLTLVIVIYYHRSGFLISLLELELCKVAALTRLTNMCKKAAQRNASLFIR